MGAQEFRRTPRDPRGECRRVADRRRCRGGLRLVPSAGRRRHRAPRPRGRERVGGTRRTRRGTPSVTAQAYDLLATGRPSVDVMFSGLPQWPELGKDIDAVDLGVCAGTSFNTPAAANRLGLRVGYVGLIGNDVWSRIVREEFDAEGLPTDFLRVADRPMPFVSVALNFDHDRGFVSYEGAHDGDDEELLSYALEVVSTTPARHLHAHAGEEPSELSAVARERGMTVSLDAWSGPWWEAPAPLAD